jgi:hypothetical protein
VDGFTDHGVLEPLLGPDIAGHHLARRNSGPGRASGHLGAQPFGDRPRGRQRLVLGVVQGYRRTEHRQRGVALELAHQASIDHRNALTVRRVIQKVPRASASAM